MAYAVIRHYKGSTALIDELGRRPDQVESLIRGVAGFQQYYLVRSGDGVFSVSVFRDMAGADESVHVAAQWIKENVPDVAGDPPEVIAGEVTISFASTA
jgi:heme-degrading monooxygenase HmoA